MSGLQVFYTTKHYDIISTLSPNKDEVCNKYGVQNKTTKMVEFYIDTFDNAMVAAETLTYILDNATWRHQVKQNIESIKSSLGKEVPKSASQFLSS